MEALKISFEDMGLAKYCHFAIHGKMAYDRAVMIIKEALNANPEELPIRPLSAMLLDF